VKSRSKLWWITFHLSAVALSIVFFALGVWQLNRAADLKASVKPVADFAALPLDQVLKVGESFNSSMSDRRVTFAGRYVSNFFVIQNGVRNEVALAQTSGGSILVLRGAGSPATLNQDVTISGRLQPPSAENPNSNSDQSNQLSRIDPVLIADRFSPLIRGYVAAYSEIGLSNSTIKFTIDLNSTPAVKKVPGFYWQHILYAVLWWMMILTVIYLWIRTIRVERQN
jgi:hypothetical protein